MNQFATKWENALKEVRACQTELNKLLTAETELESVKVVCNNIVWSMNNLPEMVKEAIGLYPDGIKAYNWYAVRNAASNGKLNIIKYLHSITDISDGIKARGWFAVRKANTETKQWFKTTFPELMKECPNEYLVISFI